MIGINVDDMTLAIKKVDSYSDSVDSNVESLIKNINELNNLYFGNDINFLFQGLIYEIESIKTIPSVINNYSDVLNDVLEAYDSQSNNVKSKFDIVTDRTNI